MSNPTSILSQIFPLDSNSPKKTNGIRKMVALTTPSQTVQKHFFNTNGKLELFRDLVNKGENFENQYILQTANIDLKNEEWFPIGIYQSGNYFKGIYDGGNHYIENISITNAYPDEPANVGFFGMLDGTVKNLGIESGNIQGVCVGSITSHANTGGNTYIINCYNKANITGSSRAGGICDNLNGGTIINCLNEGEVSGPDSWPIVSYNASNISCIFPNEMAIPETFDGLYTNIPMFGNTLQERLNNGLDQLLQNGLLNDPSISKW